jgi:hypothetical protein
MKECTKYRMTEKKRTEDKGGREGGQEQHKKRMKE